MRIFMTDEEVEELGYRFNGTVIYIAGVKYKVLEATPKGFYLNKL